MPPSRRATSASTCSRLATFAAWRALAASARIAAAASSAPFASTSPSTTRAPAAASTSAVARPMPLAAPVTTATRPLSRTLDSRHARVAPSSAARRLGPIARAMRTCPASSGWMPSGSRSRGTSARPRTSVSAASPDARAASSVPSNAARRSASVAPSLLGAPSASARRIGLMATIGVRGCAARTIARKRAQPGGEQLAECGVRVQQFVPWAIAIS